MQFSIGHSDAVDLRDAIDEVVRSLAECLCDEKPVAALVFSSPEYDNELFLRLLSEHYPGVPIAGCVAAGLMCSLGYAEDGITVGLFHSAVGNFWIGSASGDGLSDGLETAISTVVDEALSAGPSTPPRLCFVFSSFVHDLAEVGRIVSEKVGPDCMVIGGGAGDHRVALEDPARPAQFGACGVTYDGVSVLVVGGEVMLSSSVGSGWRGVGTSAVVSKSSGNLVLELDGRPAREQLNAWNLKSGALPIVTPVLARFDGNSQAMRPLFAVDEETGGALFGSEVPEGSELEPCAVLNAELLATSGRVIERALGGYSGIAPSGAFVVCCAARQWSLGSRVAREHEVIEEALGGVPYLGFYSFGEIAPASNGAEYHSHSCAAVVFGAV
jgi:hypothetical protein